MQVAVGRFLLFGIVSSAAFTTDTPAGRELMAQARALGDYFDYSFVGQYSIKFQGCHHVQQWNSNNYNNNNNNNNNNNKNNKNNQNYKNENQVRIMTKRLVRFRLCPSDSCNSDRTSGCSAKYGDYIVDMNNFVTYYMNSLEEQKEQVCGPMADYCKEVCSGSEEENCNSDCYESGDASFCLETDMAEQNNFNVNGYLSCTKFKYNADKNVQYYIGPFCAAQGGEIHLGVFSDDTCTTRVEDGDSWFTNLMGFDLPFADDSLITSRCIKCGFTQSGGSVSNSENCAAIYQYSGKCETRMNIEYPNESSCDYIEGIKIVREDGVIRTSSIRKSKGAAVAIGLFICLSVLLAGYVFYLRTKLSRAQINLAASSNPLT